MAERSYPTQWTALLTDEAARWVQQGVITEEQSKAILSLYPAPASGGRDRTILIFTILGSLLVAAGVILFFAANWPRIPAMAKVGALLAAVAGCYGVGYYLQFRRTDYPRLGHSIIFLGALLYGASIWLIAQIFHLETNFAVGFLYWGLGVLPLAWAISSLPILYLATGTLIIWTIGRQTGALTYNALFPLLMAVAVLPLTRRLRSAMAEAGVLGGIFIWFFVGAMTHGSATRINAEALIIGPLLMLYGSALLAAGVARLGDPRAYLGLGGVMALAGSYALTFNYYLPTGVSMPALWAEPAFTAGGAALLIAAAAAGAVLCLRKGESGRLVLAPLVLVPALAGALAYLPAEVPRMILFNVLLFTGTVGFIVMGVRQRSELLVNVGLGAFIIHMLTRYFDLFFSAMNKSLFFVVGGILLLLGGWLLERNRRRWMRDWGGDHDATA
jgi:uncharacterized membrane protein